MKTLLAIGDKCDFEAFKKFKNATKKETGFKYLNINYDKVLSKKLPKIKTKEIIIYLFFPFDYWNKYIEPKNYKGVYASSKFYNRFKILCKRIRKNIESTYKYKKIHYVIPPNIMHYDRDKEITKNILRKAKINVPKTIKTRNIKEIKKLIKKNNIFIKVRYGAMGKGITYLTKDKWLTNFRFSRGKIKSRKSDYGWTFIDITNNEAFLKELLKQDIVIEEEINQYIIDKKKFDLRIYVSFNNVRYIYPRTNKSIEVITNISQGGKGESQAFLKKIPKKLLDDAKNVAINTTKVMKTNFAGVDVMFDGKRKKPVVIEVNVFPGFPKSKGFNLSKRILGDIKMNYKLKVRKATMDDFDELLRLKLESKLEERRLNKDLEPINKVKNQYSKYIKQDIKSKHRAVFIAILNGKIIGMIIGRIYRSLRVVGYKRRSSMGNLFVKKEYRRKGIANELIKSFIQWAKSRKVNDITLNVYKDNIPVRDMYLKHGFKESFIAMSKKL